MPGIDPNVIVEVAKELLAFVHAQVSDPAKDRQRLGRLDKAHGLAKVGDVTPQPDLDNLSGADYIELIVSDAQVPGGGTTSGSKIALAYAKLTKLRLQAGV